MLTTSNQAEFTVQIDLVPEFALVIFKGEVRVAENSTLAWKSKIVHLHLIKKMQYSQSHHLFPFSWNVVLTER